jgi:hypothetical protein
MLLTQVVVVKVQIMQAAQEVELEVLLNGVRVIVMFHMMVEMEVALLHQVQQEEGEVKVLQVTQLEQEVAVVLLDARLHRDMEILMMEVTEAVHLPVLELLPEVVVVEEPRLVPLMVVMVVVVEL